MTTDNLDGDGFADQPSIIYAFDDGDEIREISRSGHLTPGKSPGDIVERESTRSNPTDQLPVLDLAGGPGLKYDDCGDKIPALACNHCGKVKRVGRCCESPVCERDWPAAVKNKVVRAATKLDACRRKIYAKYDGEKDIDINHVVASLPDFAVDSQNPVERARLVLKTLLSHNWGIENFLTIYHPYRIAKEYRKDEYEHGGAPGEGDMTWADVMSSENPKQYLEYSPHFHIFFPAVRASFDYLVAEAVEEKSGWLLHRITPEDNNISVENKDELVRQVTYAMSHAGVNEWNADRAELTSRMKGELHNLSVSDELRAECASIFCDIAPKLLGTHFIDTTETSCDAEVDTDAVAEQNNTTANVNQSDKADSETQPEDDNNTIGDTPESATDSTNGEEGPKLSEKSEVDNHSESASISGDTKSENAENQPESQAQTGGNELSTDDSSKTKPPVIDRRVQCGGEWVPMGEAKKLLSDADWCKKAPYVSELREAAKEWTRMTDSRGESSQMLIQTYAPNPD